MGGAEAMLWQVASALRALGFKQRIVSLTSADFYSQRFESAGIAVDQLRADRLNSGPAALVRLTRIVRKERPDLLCGWMYHGNLAAALAHRLAGGRSDRRLVWNLRASNMDAARYGLINRCSAWLSRWPDVVVANSDAGARSHLALGYHPRRLEIIPNGIDVAKFKPDPECRRDVRRRLGIAPDAIVAVLVARVDAMKDHATFLAAMNQTPKVQGLLIGQGTEKLSLPSNVRALGLQQRVEQLYPAADLVVLSSAFGEGFPNVLAEGMSAGLVPVATDVGDSRIIVDDTGRIVPPGDPVALAAAIAAEAERPSDERKARGLRARERIRNTYPIGKTVEAMSRLYTSLLATG
jgi:glycosyltransferase involved in cell wall biosynthesis